MKTNNANAERRPYLLPNIERIELDAEISLILQSESNSPDGEPTSSMEYFNNNPFKNDIYS